MVRRVITSSLALLLIVWTAVGCEPAEPEEIAPAFEPVADVEGEYMDQLLVEHEAMEQERVEIEAPRSEIDAAYAAMEEDALGPEVEEKVADWSELREEVAVNHRWMQRRVEDPEIVAESSMALEYHQEHRARMLETHRQHTGLAELHEQLAEESREAGREEIAAHHETLHAHHEEMAAMTQENALRMQEVEEEIAALNEEGAA